ncbi:hypothetical protein EBB04_22205 [Sinorhizobium meliloti]|nr:hypothetical protein [Sinorhizobium meliloti]RMC64867.1 hypothetical protein EBB04_22205 [Sinorhizobium meliloti]
MGVTCGSRNAHDVITHLQIAAVLEPGMKACIPKHKNIETGVIANDGGEPSVRLIKRSIGTDGLTGNTKNHLVFTSGPFAGTADETIGIDPQPECLRRGQVNEKRLAGKIAVTSHSAPERKQQCLM